MAATNVELVRVPDVVLIGERHTVGLVRDERKGALEVAIESEPFRASRGDEPLVLGACALDVRERPRLRRVVTDKADEARMGLGADRFDLVLE